MKVSAQLYLFKYYKLLAKTVTRKTVNPKRVI